MFSIKNAFDVYQKTKSLGEKSINSEYMFVIDGEPDVEYLMKQFPLPITAPEDIIEVPMVGGIKGGTQQIPRFDHRGACALSETASGHARDLLERAQARVRCRNAQNLAVPSIMAHPIIILKNGELLTHNFSDSILLMLMWKIVGN